MNTSKICSQCGAPIDEDAKECRYCGYETDDYEDQKKVSKQAGLMPATVIMNTYTPQNNQEPVYGGIDPSWPIKSKGIAAALAILFGGIGAHKFYLGKIGQGVVYLCFVCTGITVFIGFVEGIIYLLQSDEEFQTKYHVRISR